MRGTATVTVRPEDCVPASTHPRTDGVASSWGQTVRCGWTRSAPDVPRRRDPLTSPGDVPSDVPASVAETVLPPRTDRATAQPVGTSGAVP